MIKPTGLTFSLRLDATESIQIVKDRVEKTLGCMLLSDTFGGVPAWTGKVLGMQIGLLLWRGINGMHTYQLHGRPDWNDFRPTEWEEVRIDRAIGYMLQQCGAGEWREPTKEELKAEGQYDLEDI